MTWRATTTDPAVLWGYGRGVKFEPGHDSKDIEDRRGSPGRRMPGGAKLGAGGLIIALIGLFFGRNFISGLGGSDESSGGGGGQTQAPPSGTDPDAKLVQFMGSVLDDAQDAWTKIFQGESQRYVRAKMVLFSRGTESGCGYASSAIGPFYCPPDQKVYLDLDFFRALSARLGAPGDFAQAYVIAHEVGHHVQNLLGYDHEFAQHIESSGKNSPEASAWSVRQELQADCLAGGWAHGAAQRDLLEAGDLEEGLNAAAAIGDDTLAKKAGAEVVPESFTHGTSAQRVRWFKRGFERGQVLDCDTMQGPL